VIQRAKNHAAALLIAGATVLAMPSLALAGTGGTGLSAGSSPTSTPTSPTTGSTTNPLVGNGEATVTASGSGITVSTTATALLRNQLTFTGAAPTSDSGDTVEIERLGHETDYAWTPTATATVAPDGSFTAPWLTDHIGQFSIRAQIETTDAQAAAASPVLSVVVYLPAIATWYGPGFYGKHLACGGKYQRGMLGVANRTLPCGTKVDLMYDGRTLTVPVIDRGPYANHASWDLTAATGQALGMTGTETIGAASIPSASAG
jgi:rare lipoprotein A